MSNLYQLARHFQRKYPGENSCLVFTGVLRINRMIYTCSVTWYAGSWAVISIGNARIAFPSSTWRLQCHVKDKDIIHPIISSTVRSRSSFPTSLRRNAEKLSFMGTYPNSSSFGLLFAWMSLVLQSSASCSAWPEPIVPKPISICFISWIWTWVYS